MKRILIIEDNEDIRDNVAEILMLSNYKVLMAENGKEGIETAKKELPDLIISDIMMPGIDGHGVLHALHKDPTTQNIPFIFLTSKSERSDFRTAMEMGADDYITKPFAGNELLSAIDSRFKKLEIMKKKLSPDLEGLTELMSTLSNKKSLEDLKNESNTNTYKKRQVIYKEGTHPHYLYYIIRGKVKTYKTHEDGKDLVMDLYREGDFFGYVSLLEGTTYKENAESIEETELGMIPKKDFEELINSNPETAQKFIGLLAKNLVEKEKQLLGIAYNTLRKKVAEALISLQRKYHINKHEPYQIDISRDDLATVAGTATESLIRTLSDFKGEHLIDIKSGKVIIMDNGKLENLVR
jgi:CRP/FNR family transcriptional regulator, cyclic AMP receptor protein